jgi:hypothetical protein
MDWRVCGRKRLLPDLRYYTSTSGDSGTPQKKLRIVAVRAKFELGASQI